MQENLSTLQRDWEDLGEIDPLWAVLSSNGKRHGRWKEQEFYATGVNFVELILKRFQNLGVQLQYEQALDFGCGVGRLTMALGQSFRHATGVDISRSMLDRAETTARNLNCTNVEFKHNVRSDLRDLPNNGFDLVMTYIVLQHVPEQAAIESYVREFVRILRPGGALFIQIPTHVHWLRRIQPKRRLYTALRGLGLPHNVLYSRLGLHPIYYNWLSPERFENCMGDARILAQDHSLCARGSVTSSNYWITK